MEELFLREQLTYPHNPEFLRNVVENEIGRIEDISWNPIPDDQNDINLGETMYETEEVFLANVIQLKGTARKSEPGYKPACQVQTRSRQEALKGLA